MVELLVVIHVFIPWLNYTLAKTVERPLERIAWYLSQTTENTETITSKGSMHFTVWTIVTVATVTTLALTRNFEKLRDTGYKYINDFSDSPFRSDNLNTFHLKSEVGDSKSRPPVKSGLYRTKK